MLDLYSTSLSLKTTSLFMDDGVLGKHMPYYTLGIEERLQATLLSMLTDGILARIYRFTQIRRFQERSEQRAF